MCQPDKLPGAPAIAFLVLICGQSRPPGLDIRVCTPLSVQTLDSYWTDTGSGSNCIIPGGTPTTYPANTNTYNFCGSGSSQQVQTVPLRSTDQTQYGQIFLMRDYNGLLYITVAFDSVDPVNQMYYQVGRDATRGIHTVYTNIHIRT